MEYINSTMESIIDEHIHSARDRAILKRKLIDGITYDQLAEDFDLDDSTVKRIVRKHRKNIAKYL